MPATREAKQNHARNTLHRLGISHGASFHALPSDKVDALLEEADLAHYR